jgi:hypothetical protein
MRVAVTSTARSSPKASGPLVTAGYNVLGMALAATGWLPPIAAVAAQSLPDVAVMLMSRLRIAATCGRLTAMPRRSQWLTVTLLTLWVLLGPLAMAFGGCLAMADCEALCGLLPGLSLAQGAVALAAASRPILWASLLTPPSLTPAVLEPPPRRSLPA